MKTEKFQLNNGLDVILVESHRSPVVSIQMWVKTGSADEKRGVEGVSHFIEHLVFKGTEKYGLGEIAQTIEGHGGELNAYTSFDQTVFYVTISKAYVEKGLDVINQMIAAPTFQQEDIDSEREVVLEEIKRGEDSLHRQASRLLFSSLYKKHPYKRPVIGYANVIQKIKRQKILEYFENRYAPRNMFLVVSGDFESKALKKTIAEKFSNLKKRRGEVVRREKESLQEKARICVEQSDFQENILHMAWPIPDVKSKDIAALDLLSMVMGGFETSPLMRELCLENPVTNYTASSTFTPKDKGFYNISSSVKEGFLDQTLSGIQKIIHEFQAGVIDEQALERAKTNVQSDEYFSLQSVDSQAKNLGQFEFLFKNPLYFETYLKNIRNVSVQDLVRVSRKYLKPEKMNLIYFASKDNGKKSTKEEISAKKRVEEIKKEIQVWLKGVGKKQGDTGNKEIEKENKKGKAKANETAGASASSTANSSKANHKKEIRWKMPKTSDVQPPQIFKTPSGLRWIHRHDPLTPVVSLQLAFLGGSRIEEKGKYGLSNLVGKVWPTQVKGFTEAQLNARMEAIAARAGAFAGRNTTGLTMSFLSPFREEALGLFQKILLEPEISSEILEREKLSVYDDFKNRADSPAQVCLQSLNEKVFNGHPYALDPLGRREDIEGIKSQDILDYLSRQKRASQTCLSVVGDITSEQMQKLIEDIDKNLVKKSLAWSSHSLASLKAKSSHSFHKLDKNQSHLAIAYQGLNFMDSRRYALNVMQAVLSGQGGRLFMELRDKMSLAYTVMPLRMEGIDAGYFGAYIACSPEKVTTSLGMLKKELMKLVETKISSEELTRAKRYLIGKHDIGLQKNSSIASTMLFDEIYGIPFDEPFRYSQNILKVTAEDIQSLAQDLFVNKVAALSLVGPEDIDSSLENVDSGNVLNITKASSLKRA